MKKQNISPVGIIAAIGWFVLGIIGLYNMFFRFGYMTYLELAVNLAFLVVGIFVFVDIRARYWIFLGIACLLAFQYFSSAASYLSEDYSFTKTQSIGYVVRGISSLLMGACCVDAWKGRFRAPRVLSGKLWFLPGVLSFAGGIVVMLAAMLPYFDVEYFFYTLINNVDYMLLEPLVFFLFCFWLPRAYGSFSGPNGTKTPMSKHLSTNRGLAKYIFLSLITFGIYGIVMMSEISTSINTIARKHDGRKTMHFCLVAFIFSWLTCGIVPLVWYTKMSSRVGAELQRRRIPYSFGGGTFWGWNVLGSLIAVGPFIYMFKLCKSMNLLSESYNTNDALADTMPDYPQQNYQQPVYTQQQPSYQPPQQHITPEVANELKTCKELLDMGVMTQQEFDRKKQELLGL